MATSFVHVDAVVRETARRYPGRPALRAVGRQPITYAELDSRVRRAAAGLVAAGVRPGDAVGILAPNCPEWTVIDLAVLSVGAVCVPIYATNTAAQAAYVVEDAQVALLFVGGTGQRATVPDVRGLAPVLRRVVDLDDTGDDARDGSAGPGTETLRRFLEHGDGGGHADEVQRRIDAAAADDVATLIYTSGTTGEPKGAVLTHGNFLHQVRGLDDRFAVAPTDRSLCFLPLSHAYERGWTFYVLAKGAENCYLDDPTQVVAAMGEVRPTVMVSVPRLYEKVHAGVLQQVAQASAARQRLFRWAMRVGADYQRRALAGERVPLTTRAAHAVADRMVLSTIRDVVGGDKKVLAAGGAPLGRDIEEFFLAAGLFVCQGYGLTETTAMLTCNYPGRFRLGSVGTPVAGTEIRISADGEILARGGSIMRGYHGKPQATAEAFTDGWFRTGDLGEVDADGFVFVTDRIKDLIITSQGKNVAPQRIEGLIGADPYVEQIVVIGDRRTYLSALIEPAFTVLEQWAQEHHVPYASREELVAAPEVRSLYDARIDAASRELAGYERVKRYTLMPREFRMESGEVTPTLKLRRATIEAEFADVIDAMYDAPRDADARGDDAPLAPAEGTA